MYDYGYQQLITETRATNEKLDTIHEDLQCTNLFCGALLIMVIVGVLLSIIKS